VGLAGAVGAAVLLLGLVGACGNDGGGGPEAAAPAKTASTPTVGASGPASTAQAAPTAHAVPLPSLTGPAVLTTARLRSLTFKEGATPGTSGMPVSDLKSAAAEQAKRRPVTPEACRDTMDVAYGRTAPAGVSQFINWKQGLTSAATVLAAYPHGAAAGLFRALAADLPLCTQVSGIDYSGTPFTNRIVHETAPKAGDQAVRFDEVAQLSDGSVRHTDRIVVRVGDVIAEFEMIDVNEHSAFPVDLLTQQLQRLAAAQH
jgi:hypothetical protein